MTPADVETATRIIKQTFIDVRHGRQRMDGKTRRALVQAYAELLKHKKELEIN